MKSLYKLIVAIYLTIWSIVLGQLLNGIVSHPLLESIIPFMALHNWLMLIVGFFKYHLLALVFVFSVKVIRERKVEKVRASIEK